MIIVADTSPILNLDVIGRLDLLRALFGDIAIPPSVDAELRAEPYGFVRPDWLRVVAPHRAEDVTRLLQSLNRGEAEAIILASELSADFLLIDERRGRSAASERGVRSLGLLGVLLLCKKQRLIDAVNPLLAELTAKAGMWIGPALYRKVLEEAGEAEGGR